MTEAKEEMKAGAEEAPAMTAKAEAEMLRKVKGLGGDVLVGQLKAAQHKKLHSPYVKMLTAEYHDRVKAHKLEAHLIQKKEKES